MKKSFLPWLLLLVLCCMTAAAAAEEYEEPEERPHAQIGTIDLRDNGIPVVYLSIDPKEYQSVLESSDHSYRAQGGSIRITIPEGYVSEYGAFDASFADRELALDYIRGRGHSTWSQDKRPFKFRLAEKADLFGMGAGREWALMANAYDDSLLKNRLSGYIGSAMGFACYPEFVPVDLVINGSYMGSYQISSYVQIAENSLNIKKVKKDAVGEPGISGGYLIGMEPYSTEPEINVITTRGGFRFVIATPDLSKYGEDMREAQQAQRSYVENYLQQVEDAVFGENGYNSSGTHYSELMDVGSAAAYWWVQEFCVNRDAYRSPSTYLYKEMDNKLFWGPLWDFDIAFGAVGSCGDLNGKMLWLDYLRQYDPEYRQILRDTWAVLDGAIRDITREGGILDRYCAEIKRSWENNKELWNTTDRDLDEIVSAIKEDLELHRQAVAEHLDEELPRALAPVTFMDGDSVCAVVQVYLRGGLEGSRFPAAPEKEGFKFVRWADQNGKTYEPYTELDGPVTVYAEYAPVK